MHDPNAFADTVILMVKAALAPLQERLAALEARHSTFVSAEKALTELRDRVVTVETKAATPVPLDAAYYELRDRLLAIETKAVPAVDVPSDVLARLSAIEARPVAEPVNVPAVDLSPVLERVAKLEMDVTKDLGIVRERLAVVETKAPVPGPAGQNGSDGKDGQNGKDGVDGLGFDELAAVQNDDRSITVKAMRGDKVKEIGTFTLPVEIYRGVWLEGKTYERGDGVTWAGSEWHCNEDTTSKPGEGSKAWTLKVKRGRDGRDGKDAPGAIPVVKVS